MMSLIYNELVNMRKKQLTHREETSGYQWKEGWGRVNIQAGD